MQLNNLVLAMAALTGTALALPAPTITSGPTSISASSTPSASSTSSKAMTTPTPTSANRTWGKIVAGPAASPSAAHTTNNNGTTHGAAEFKHYAPPQDRCPSLCSLQAQACVVALPHDEAFCYSTYEGCSKRCGRQ